MSLPPSLSPLSSPSSRPQSSPGSSCNLAVVVAAGSGQRFGAPLPKQYHPLGKTSVLGQTLRRLQASAAPRHTVVVIHPDYRAEAQQALCALPEEARASHLLVAGGASRQASVRLGLEALTPLARANDLVFIHDAARPLLSPALAQRLSAAARATGASLPVLPVADTLKRVQPRGDASGQASGQESDQVSGQQDGETILSTQDRSGLMRAQTPQVFAYSAILEAHQRLAERDDLTDDASLFEALGLPVAAVAGDERLLKITSQADLELMRALLHLEVRAP